MKDFKIVIENRKFKAYVKGELEKFEVFVFMFKQNVPFNLDLRQTNNNPNITSLEILRDLTYGDNWSFNTTYNSHNGDGIVSAQKKLRVDEEENFRLYLKTLQFQLGYHIYVTECH